MKDRDGSKSQVTEFGIGTARGGISYVIGSLVRAVALFLLLIIQAYLLTSTSFGLYTLAIAFYAIIEIIGYFGIGTALRKRLPESKSKEHSMRIITGGYLYSLVMGILLGVIGIALSGYIANSVYHNPAVVYLLQIASATVIIDVMFNAGTSALLGLLRNRDAAVANVSYSISNLIFSPLLVILGYGVPGALFGLMIAYFVGAAVAFFYIVKNIGFRFLKPTKQMIDDLTYFSIPVFVSNMSNLGATNFGILFLGAYVTTAMLGNYGAAYRLGSFVLVILNSATFVLLPAFSHAFTNEKLSNRIGSVFNGSVYYTLLFLFAILAYMISVSIPLGSVLFPGKFVPLYFAIIVIGITASTIGVYAGTLLIGHGSVRQFMKYQVGIAAIEVIAMVALVPWFGISFAPIGLLASFYIIGPILSDIIYARALLKKFSFKMRLGPLFRLTLSAIALCLILYAVSVFLHQSRFVILINALLALLLYPPILGLFKAVKIENLEFVEKIGHRIRRIEPVARIFGSYARIFVKQ